MLTLPSEPPWAVIGKFVPSEACNAYGADPDKWTIEFNQWLYDNDIRRDYYDFIVSLRGHRKTPSTDGHTASYPDQKDGELPFRWHSDGSTDWIIVWSDCRPTEIKRHLVGQGTIPSPESMPDFIPEPFDVVIFSNTKCVHRAAQRDGRPRRFARVSITH